MSDPTWLLEMRAITGTKETPGTGDNPKILAMADTIAAAYPDMATYCATYQHDETPWCGLTMAYVMTKAGIRPVWGPTDTDRWLWAQAWKDLKWGTKLEQPRPGCVVVMTRSGGGHVTLYERTEGSSYVCRGGNQGDAINVSSYPISNVIALMWPQQGGPLPPVPRPELEEGDTGADVEYLQTVLGVPCDGEFGPTTEGAVKGFQAASGLEVDGVVGSATWAKIDDLAIRLDSGDEGLPDELQQAIAELALKSPIQTFSWKDRGRSPPGYVAGMGQAYALALGWLQAGRPAAIEMAQKAGNRDIDALAWYAAEFANLNMSNATAGKDTLRHLFMFMIGLGMRESSGQYCEGRDTTASNVTADTAEAGLFQTSWNIKTASPNLPPLLEEFWTDPNGFLPTFCQKVQPSGSDLQNYGSGPGAMYQFLAKYCPVFAVFVTAIGLRTRRNHWGPVGRREVQLVKDADDFLQEVEGLCQQQPPEPVPEPEPEVATVAIQTTGKITVTVNGKLVS
jgi:uncharacterized protein (TIGR02594 family)